MTARVALITAFAAVQIASGQQADKCSGLVSPVVTSAVEKQASPAAGRTPGLPAHCEVTGKLNERTGANGQHYAINFHMRLPAEWNGKFFFEGGGGANGNLGAAYGNLQGQQTTSALTLGYAVVSQDSGHNNST